MNAFSITHFVPIKCLICVCMLGGTTWAHLFLEFGLTDSPCVLLIRFLRIKQLIGPEGRATEVSANKRKPLYLHLNRFYGTPAQFFKILHPLISRCSYRRLVFAVKRWSTTLPVLGLVPPSNSPVVSDLP